MVKELTDNTVFGVLVSQEQYLEYLELKQRSKERRYYINTYKTTNVNGSWVASEKYIMDLSCEDDIRKAVSAWVEDSIKKAEEHISAHIENNKDGFREEIERLEGLKDYLNEEIDELWNKKKSLEKKRKSIFKIF